MLIFGTSLYVMFVGTKTVKGKGPLLSGSNFFGLFYVKVTFNSFKLYICFTKINISLGKALVTAPVQNLFKWFLYLIPVTSNMGWDAISFSSQIENRPCCDDATSSGSVGQVKEYTCGYGVGSCMFCGGCVYFFSCHLPSLETLRQKY